MVRASILAGIGLAATLASGGAAQPMSQAEANALLRATPEIYNGLFTAALIKHISDSCPDSIDPPGKLARFTYFMGLYNKARGLGLSRAQIEAFVEDRAEREHMRDLVFTYLRAADVRPRNKKAVCNYASEQIRENTSLGQRLREK